MYWLIFFVAGAVALVLYMVKEAFGNEILEHEVVVPGEGEPFTLFFISDTHNRRIHPKILRSLKGRVDYVVIGGDFVDGRTKKTKMEYNMKGLTSVAPTFFVWGNNDKEVDADLFLPLLEQYGIAIICNDSIQLREGIRLCAIDFNGTLPMIEEAIRACSVEDQIIFVSHDPHRFNKVSTFVKPLLFLGGHLHGGQIRFGRFGMFEKGSFEKRFDTYQLISNGYGTTLLPFRLGAKAECHLIHFRFQK